MLITKFLQAFGFVGLRCWLMWAYAAHTCTSFFYEESLLVYYEASSDKKGARDRLSVTAGAQPPGISKGCPLRHAFRIFPRERKDTAVWSAQLHEEEVC